MILFLQLDPTKEKVYDILEMIYREFYDMFGFDSFHMGDSQFHIDCWNASSEITDFMENDVRLKDKDVNGKEINKLITKLGYEIPI